MRHDAHPEQLGTFFDIQRKLCLDGSIGVGQTLIFDTSDQFPLRQDLCPIFSRVILIVCDLWPTRGTHCSEDRTSQNPRQHSTTDTWKRHLESNWNSAARCETSNWKCSVEWTTMNVWNRIQATPLFSAVFGCFSRHRPVSRPKGA